MKLNEIVHKAPVLYLAVGPSGAGKSTYFKQIQQADPSVLYYSWDALRHEFYDQKDYRRAWELSTKDPHWNTRQRERFQEMMRRGKSIYVDNTNVSEKARRPFIQAAKQAGYRVVGVVFNVPLEDVVARQTTRSDKSVPIEAVTTQWNAVHTKPPQKQEGFDEIIQVGGAAPPTRG